MAGIAGDRNAWCFDEGAAAIGTSKKSKIYDFGEVLTWKSEKILGADKRLLLAEKYFRVRTQDDVTGGTGKNPGRRYWRNSHGIRKHCQHSLR